MKKILSLLCVAVFLFNTAAFVPVSVYAADAENTTENEKPAKLENCEIITQKDADAFSDLLSDMISNDGEYIEDIVIDTDEDTSAAAVSGVNGDKIEVAASVITQAEGDALNYEESENTLNENAVLSDGDLEKLGYEASVNGSIVTISKVYQTMRLVVPETNIEHTFGAISGISDGREKTILQYGNVEDTVNAVSCFEEEGVAVYPDSVASICITDDQQNKLNDEWGKASLESSRFINERLGSSTEEVVVAIVDTGVNYNHEFLRDRILSGGDLIDNDDNPMDENNHGTHCAGIVVNNTPENVKILPVRVFNKKGTSSFLLIAEGIKWAADNGANIISMSFCGRNYDNNTIIEDAVNYATEKGCLCVAAAGNESDNANNYSPANCANAFTVASLDKSDKLSSFSNYGTCVDVAMPGEKIYSSVITGYAKLSGTSMATPFASAAAALLLCENGTITVPQIKETLSSAAVDLGLEGKDGVYGSGRVDFGCYLGDRIEAETIESTAEEYTFCYSNYLRCHPEHIKAVVKPYAATDKSYRLISSDDSIVSVENGFVEPVSPGEATITVKLNETQYYLIYVHVKDSENWLDAAADSYGGGSGTFNDPYIISTPEQLAKISRDYFEHKLPYDVYYRQNADIDLAGKQWYPIIPGDEESRASRCHYDGAGYDVKHLTYIQEDNELNLFSVGFFDYNRGLIENVNLVDVEINSTSNWVGGIAGAGYGPILNCTVSGTVEGGSTQGGIVGELMPYEVTHYTCVIKDCYCNAKITGNNPGGIVGSANGDIINCVFMGSIVCTNPEFDAESRINHIGGICCRISNANYGSNGLKPNEIINCVSNHNIFGNRDLYKKENNENPVSFIDNCYCLENTCFNDMAEGLVNDGITVVSEAFFNDEDAYKNAENWDKRFVPDFENNWQITEDGISHKKQKASARSGEFAYALINGKAIVFGYCGKETEVTIPNDFEGVSSLIIARYFDGIKNVKTVHFSASVEEISAFAMMENKSLEHITFEEGTKRIGGHAFYSDSYLQSVVLPETLEYLGKWTFAECSYMKNLFFKGSPNCVSMPSRVFDSKRSAAIRYLEKYSDEIDPTEWKNYYATCVLKPYDPESVMEVSLLTYKRGYNNRRENEINFADNVRVPYGTTLKFDPQIFNKNAKNTEVIWSSSKPEKMPVSDDGTFVVTTSAKITVTAADGSDSDTITINFYYVPINVVFVGNGATSGKMEPQTFSPYSSENLTPNSYKRKGYIFKGWSLNKNAKECDYSNNSIPRFSADYNGKTVKLYAVWKPIKYKIRFQSNGGTGKMKTVKATYGKKVKLPKNRYKKKGYTFKGWAVKKGGKVKYKNAAKVKNLTAKSKKTVKLYAVWSKKK